MKTGILFIAQGFSFMSNSIQKSFETAGYEVTRAEPEIEIVSKYKDELNIFVLFLGKFVYDSSDILVYLKDVCLEQEKFLILLGNHDEIDFAQKSLPTSAVTAIYERPVDLKRLTQEIGQLAQAVSMREAQKSILLVDDDPTFLKMMKGWLETDYRVTIVTSGMQALMYITDNKPDLILLDYEMPVTSGPQVLEMIRSESKVDNTPVMFLTGKGDKESVMKVLSLKPDGYLLKNLNRAQILAALEDFFEKRRAEELNAKSSL